MSAWGWIALGGYIVVALAAGVISFAIISEIEQFGQRR